MKKIKKGDTVVVYNGYANRGTDREAHEDTVKSSGSKWITTTNCQIRFDAITLRGEWGGSRLFLGTMKEYEDWKSKERLRKDMIREIENRLNDVSYEEALAIMQIIK